jgi:hypothetical protein
MQSASQSITEKPSNVGLYHSPNTILTIYAQHIKSIVDNKLILVKGVYIDVPNANSYSGYYYENLKGENDTSLIKIKVPAIVRSKLQSKQIYVFSGVIEKKVTASSIEIVFCINDVLSVEKSQYTEAELEGYKIIQRKVAKGYVDVEAKIRESIYENKKLRIANIYGESAIVDRDFQRGIEGAIVNFDIQNFRCSLAQPQKIIETLQTLSKGNFDIIAIVRGGGDAGLEILNNPTIAAQALQLPCIFLSALGHDVNNTLLDKIADKKFSLPLHYGVTLREIVERATEELTHSKAALLEKVRSEVLKSFTDVVKAKDEQVKLLQEQVTKANTNNLELNKYYDKLIEDKISALNKQNQVAIEQIRQEQRTSQVIAAVIGFAFAFLIFYIIKS